MSGPPVFSDCRNICVYTSSPERTDNYKNLLRVSELFLKEKKTDICV